MGSRLTQGGEIEPAMRPEEIEMLARHLRPGVSYLEFGAGGSTRLALARGANPCHSVESDPAWLDRLRGDGSVRDAEAAGVLTLHRVDLGPLLAWGMPADRTRLEAWPSYYLEVWRRLERPPDVVLIDGRFRAACALSAFLACPSRTAILMHDFFDPLPIRANYRGLLDVADIVERTGQLVSLKRKPEIATPVLLGRLAAVWTDFA